MLTRNAMSITKGHFWALHVNVIIINDSESSKHRNAFNQCLRTLDALWLILFTLALTKIVEISWYDVKAKMPVLNFIFRKLDVWGVTLGLTSAYILTCGKIIFLNRLMNLDFSDQIDISSLLQMVLHLDIYSWFDLSVCR